MAQYKSKIEQLCRTHPFFRGLRGKLSFTADGSLTPAGLQAIRSTIMRKINEKDDVVISMLKKNLIGPLVSGTGDKGEALAEMVSRAKEYVKKENILSEKEMLHRDRARAGVTADGERLLDIDELRKQTQQDYQKAREKHIKDQTAAGKPPKAGDVVKPPHTAGQATFLSGKFRGVSIERTPASYVMWLHGRMDEKDFPFGDYIKRNLKQYTNDPHTMKMLKMEAEAADARFTMRQNMQEHHEEFTKERKSMTQSNIEHMQGDRTPRADGLPADPKKHEQVLEEGRYRSAGYPTNPRAGEDEGLTSKDMWKLAKGYAQPEELKMSPQEKREQSRVLRAAFVGDEGDEGKLMTKIWGMRKQGISHVSLPSEVEEWKKTLMEMDKWEATNTQIKDRAGELFAHGNKIENATTAEELKAAGEDFHKAFSRGKDDAVEGPKPLIDHPDVEDLAGRYKQRLAVFAGKGVN